MIARMSIAAAALALLVAAGEQPTPMAERVAHLAVLNKHNRQVRMIDARPGTRVGLGSLLIQVRACEAVPAYERPWTGAFLQIDERLRQGGVKRVFSGWLFAESPSLNSFEHPVYDIWVKSCTMSFPETGPDTVVLGGADASSRSSAPKSEAVSRAVAN